MSWPETVVWMGGFTTFVVSLMLCLDHFATVRAKPKQIDIQGTINGMVITHDNSHLALYGQLERVKGRGLTIYSQYIHSASVHWLCEAIDRKIADEVAEKLR